MDWAWVWFLFAVVAFVLGYLLHDNFASLKTWFADSTADTKTTSESLGAAPPPSLDTGYCTFPTQDVTLNQVYDYNGVPVGQNNIPCSTCNQYVFRDEDGCVTYGYTGDGGVCTIGGYTAQQEKTCSSDTDCRNTSNIVSLSSSMTGPRCDSGFCNTWEIQPSKMCPAGFK